MNMWKNILASLFTSNAKTSAFYYFGNFATNVGNYLFHFLLMRMLATEVYGEFLSYLSFLYLIAIPAGAVTTVVLKYIANYYGKKDKIRINQFFYLMLRKVFLPSLVLAGLVILLSPLLAELLKVQKLAFVVLGINIIISFLGSILISYSMAFQQFKFQVGVGGIQVIIKIGLAYLLITIGSGAIGAVIAILLAGTVGLLVFWWKIMPSIYPRITEVKKLKVKLEGFFTYSFIFSAGSLSLISVDVLLVRYFFVPYDSGIYSALSVLGRMIYFGIMPFSSLLLPIVSKRFSAKLETKLVWWKLASVSLLFGGIGVGIFSVIPKIVIKFLSGTQYVSGSQLLWIFALGMLVFALCRLLLTYFMAINHERSNLCFLLVIILQPLLIMIWHRTLLQVAMINLGLYVGLLISLLVYYRVAVKLVR